MANKVVLEFDVGAFAALRKGPKEFVEEVKTDAVVEWYVEARISQSKRRAWVSEARYGTFEREVMTCQWYSP